MPEKSRCEHPKPAGEVSVSVCVTRILPWHLEEVKPHLLPDQEPERDKHDRQRRPSSRTCRSPQDENPDECHHQREAVILNARLDGVAPRKIKAIDFNSHE